MNSFNKCQTSQTNQCNKQTIIKSQSTLSSINCGANHKTGIAEQSQVLTDNTQYNNEINSGGESSRTNSGRGSLILVLSGVNW